MMRKILLVAAAVFSVACGTHALADARSVQIGRDYQAQQELLELQQKLYKQQMEQQERNQKKLMEQNEQILRELRERSR